MSGPTSNGRTIITAQELLQDPDTPMRWTVEDLVPEGLAILAAPPKMGTSMLATALALSVASDSPALNGLETLTGDVLYLALELGRQRLDSCHGA